jgi:hypothetical protein
MSVKALNNWTETEPTKVKNLFRNKLGSQDSLSFFVNAVLRKFLDYKCVCLLSLYNNKLENKNML